MSFCATLGDGGAEHARKASLGSAVASCPLLPPDFDFGGIHIENNCQYLWEVWECN
jgi:hypothetical protein